MCDNWRGIALLDVVGKIVAKVFQERMQKLAEDELHPAVSGKIMEAHSEVILHLY